MPGRYKAKKSIPAIPTDSFSDLSFLLIIFFILTSSFTKTQGFLSELPSGEVSKATDTGKTPTVFVSSYEVKMNDQVVTMDQLRSRLADLKLPKKEKPDERIVMLEGSSGVDYQSYFEVMAAINRAGGVVALVKDNPTKK